MKELEEVRWEVTDEFDPNKTCECFCFPCSVRWCDGLFLRLTRCFRDRAGGFATITTQHILAAVNVNVLVVAATPSWYPETPFWLQKPINSSPAI